MCTNERNRRGQTILSGIPLEFCTVGKDGDWRDQSCGSQPSSAERVGDVRSWGWAWGIERGEKKEEKDVCAHARMCVHVCEREQEKEIDSKQPSIASFDFDCSPLVNLQVSVSKLKRCHRSMPDSEMFRTFCLSVSFCKKSVLAAIIISVLQSRENCRPGKAHSPFSRSRMGLKVSFC